VFQALYLKVQGSIQQISSATRSTQGEENKGSDLRLCRFNSKTYWTRLVLSWLEPIKGSERAASRIARSVAIVIGIALSIALAPSTQGSIGPIHTLKELADIQLTEVQEACHNEIVYRESRFISDAKNGSHHGYYQGRSTYLIDKPDDVQFYWYWYYVVNRYGITEHDEPNYCIALNHLKNKGWQ
jgi:hypothetical protein